MSNTIETTQELLSAIRTSAEHHLARHNTVDGTSTYINAERFFVLEPAPGWGWTWSAGIYTESYIHSDDVQIKEYVSHEASQDATEALAAAIAHLGPIETQR